MRFVSELFTTVNSLLFYSNNQTVSAKILIDFRKVVPELPTVES